MEYLEQVHLFAIKWIEKFRDQKISYIELVDHYLADDCQALGFQMDCGHTFSEKYGDAASIRDALNRIIDEITDIKLLGSAIYSQWRYFKRLLLFSWVRWRVGVAVCRVRRSGA